MALTTQMYPCTIMMMATSFGVLVFVGVYHKNGNGGENRLEMEK